MRGITHYLCALAASAAIPGNIQRAAAGDPWPILAGGIGGLLPDFLDFKIWRFLVRHDVSIIPDPLDPDPVIICEGMAHVMRQVHKDGRRRVVALHTMPTGAGCAIPYTIRLMPREALLAVTIDLPEQDDDTDRARTATAHLPTEVCFDYLAAITVDQGHGPELAISRMSDRHLHLSFLPWHRSWSHSCVVATGAAVLVAMALESPLHGATLLLGWGSHIVLDQSGNMGCNLFWPFTRIRSTGVGLCASDSLTGNGIVAWSSAMLILVLANQARYHPPFHTVQLVRIWLAGLALAALPRLVASLRMRRQQTG